jgi:glycosyltransferase involved in cell wall biosynthesis
VEYTQMAAYREAAPSVPAILVEHDLTFMLYRQFAERDASHAARREYQKWLRFEQERLKAYSAVWTMSEHDREQAVAAGSPPARTYAVPNGVDLERFSPRAKTSETPEILYVGSFRHRPNLLGFHELRERILPNVWKRFPSVRLRVVAGPDHEKHWAPPAGMDDRIVLHGFTADLLPMYAEATLVVVPLPVSAGTNIKLMEALSCQRAVVTTPVGSAGLELVDGQDAMIRDLGPDFAEAICALLASADLCERIARNGRATAEKRFGWRAIAGTAYETYGEIVPNLFS